MKRTDDISNKNPFKVPENYFEEVNRKIISGTSETSPVSARKTLYHRIKPYLAVAASISAFIVLSYAVSKIILPDKISRDVPEISLEEFSESYLYDIDLLILEENAESFILNEEIPEIDNSEIINYLLLENINENEIYELL